MKSIGKLKLQGEQYRIVEFEHKGKTLYGTIEEKYITDNALNQKINGLYLLIGNTVKEAVQNRKENIETVQMILSLKSNQ